MKSLLNYLYLASLLLYVKVDWSTPVRFLWYAAGSLSGSMMPSFECVDPAYDFYSKFQAYIYMPVYILFFPIPFLLVNYCTKDKGHILGVRRKNFYLSCVNVLAWIVWPSLARQAFEILHCRDINGKLYLVADVGVSCETDQYSKYSLGAYVCCGVVVFYPVLMLFILRHLKRKDLFFEIKNGKQQYKRNSGMFFFYAGVDVDFYWWWEICVLFRKWMFTAVVMLAAYQPTLQLYLCLWVLFLGFFPFRLGLHFSEFVKFDPLFHFKS